MKTEVMFLNLFSMASELVRMMWSQVLSEYVVMLRSYYVCILCLSRMKGLDAFGANSI